MKTFDLVVLRHGESLWNKENRFTGWVDIDLSPKGQEEAKQAGMLLKKEGFQFDQAYTSVLKRAVRTMWLVLEQLDAMYLPVTTSWRLNERHYGKLQGLNKTETAEKYGEEQVKIWRRSYDTLPPLIEDKELTEQKAEPRFQSIPSHEFPRGETLKTTLDRMLPYWNKTLWPQISSGQRLLVAAHGNSLRALIQHLEKLTPEQIMEINVPTGTPLLYRLNEKAEVLEKRYLGDAEEIAKAQLAVANQGKPRVG